MNPGTKTSGYLRETLVPCLRRESPLECHTTSSEQGLQQMSVSNPELPLEAEPPVRILVRQEVRCAVRFPLMLPVVLLSGEGEFSALTRNVSASGVLLELDRQLATGLEIRFSLRMPGTVLGTPRDVLVHCLGRVVRCSLSQNQYLAGATIDEYQFAEQ